jgi:DNA-binding NtrC family response regulator
MSLPWKGNVRELDNVIEHTMILAEGDHISLKDLPTSIVTSGQANPAFTYNLKDALRHFEKQHIARVLDQTGQDRREAAKLLDISLSSLYRKIEELEID